MAAAMPVSGGLFAPLPSGLVFARSGRVIDAVAAHAAANLAIAVFAVATRSWHVILNPSTPGASA